MPFQSEKQRRYLHANHPEIAKRWERDYANGGITLPKGPAGITSLNGWGSKDESQNKAGADISASMDKNPNDPGWGGGGGDGPPSIKNPPPKGPTPAEIAAAKAKAEAEKRRLEAEAYKKHFTNFKKTQKKKEFLSNVRLENEKKYFDILNKYKPDDFDIRNQMDGTSNLTKEEQDFMSKYNIGKIYEDLSKQNIENFMELKKGIAPKIDPTQYVSPREYDFAEVTDIDLKRAKEPMTKMMDYDTYKSINPGSKITPYEFEELKKGNITETGTFTAADGGQVARKKYSTGGILDITGEEEITTEEGNDISLVDETETGVSTLFKEKNNDYAVQGGVKNYLGEQEMVNAPKHWQSAPDHPKTELTYITDAEKDLLVKADLHGSLHGNVNKGPSDIISLNGWGDAEDGFGGSGNTGGNNEDKGSDHGHSRFDPGSGYYGGTTTTTTSTGDGDDAREKYIQTQYTSPEAIASKNRRDLRNMVNNWEDEWGKWDNPLDKYSYTHEGVKNRANLIDKTYNEKRAELEKQFGKNLITKIALGFLGVPVSIGFKDVKAVKSMYDLEKQYKADMQNLKDISIEQGWADFHHAVDTPMQTIEQLMLDTIRVNKDEDTGGDGPEVPVVAPVTEEIEDSYAMAGNWLQGYRDLKAKQALSAQLQEKWADEREWQQNTVFANSGGLANLFRVKN